MVSRTRRGFTLIEVLAAMTILAVIILIIGRVFADSIRSWETANKDAEINNNARAVLDFLARDLSDAIADDEISFRKEGDTGLSTYGKTAGDRLSDRLFYVTLNQDPDTTDSDGSKHKRAAREVRVEVRLMKDAQQPTPQDIPNRFRLMMLGTRNIDVLKSYGDTNWPAATSFANQVLAENVSAFEVWSYVDQYTDPKVANDLIYDSGNFDKRLPMWLDIYIELLGEKDSIKASLISDPVARAEFVDRRGKGYFRRVYFRNRFGYGFR